MAYPRWLAKINKWLFNPGQVRKGRYPVVTHVGRKSGKTYQTPLDAFPTTTGYVLVARYGPESDWVQNVLAAGERRGCGSTAPSTHSARLDWSISILRSMRLLRPSRLVISPAPTTSS